MKNTLSKTAAGLALAALSGSAALIASCASTQGVSSKAPLAAEEKTEKTAKGGARLWEMNCMSCHNMRSPSSYSDAEWEVAMHHMRIRANLTAEEHKKILAFLKAGN